MRAISEYHRNLWTGLGGTDYLDRIAKLDPFTGRVLGVLSRFVFYPNQDPVYYDASHDVYYEYNQDHQKMRFETCPTCCCHSTAKSMVIQFLEQDLKTLHERYPRDVIIKNLYEWITCMNFETLDWVTIRRELQTWYMAQQIVGVQ